MTIRVKLFAVAREVAGSPEMAVEVPDGATIADVRQSLLKALPKLQAVLSHVRWAVDSEFVDDAHSVRATSEVAIIPPVSGG